MVVVVVVGGGWGDRGGTNICWMFRYVQFLSATPTLGPSWKFCMFFFSSNESV